MSYRREIRSSQAACEPIQNQTIASNSLILSNIRWSFSTQLQDSTALVSHSIQAREYLRSLAPPGRTVAAAEVPAEVLVGIGGAMTGAVGGLQVRLRITARTDVAASCRCSPKRSVPCLPMRTIGRGKVPKTGTA